MACAALSLLSARVLHAPAMSACACVAAVQSINPCPCCRGLAAMMSLALSAASTLPPLYPLWLSDFREPGGLSSNALHRPRWHCTVQAPAALRGPNSTSPLLWGLPSIGHAAMSCCTAAKHTGMCRRRRTAEGRRAGLSVMVVGLAATLYHSTSGGLRRWCRKAGGCREAAELRWQLHQFVF